MTHNMRFKAAGAGKRLVEAHEQLTTPDWSKEPVDCVDCCAGGGVGAGVWGG